MKFPSCLLIVLAALVSIPRAVPAESSLPPGVKLLRDIEYVPGGGHSRSLDLYLPEHPAGPTPPIIYIHGGNWSEGSKEGGPGLRLPALGFAVAKINYRFSQEAVFPAQIEDCKAAVRFLRAHAAEYNLDPHNIGVWGSSAGGHLAALLGTSGGVKELEGTEGNLDASSRVQAVCDFFGPMTFAPVASPDSTNVPEGPAAAQAEAKMESPSSPVFRLLGGPPSKKLELAKLASPITFIKGSAPPFLIMHGDHDTVIPLEQSQLLHEKLKAAGVVSTLYVVPGGGHATGFDRPEIARMIGVFFNRHLHPPKG